MKLSDAEMANTMAAANSIDIDQFLHAPAGEEEQVLFLLEGAKKPEMTDKNYGSQ
jgi:hypothetical protein